MSNFENQVRVPLLVRVPWIQAMVGKHTSALVELVDLFPTLTGLAKVSHAETALEGFDFTPVLHAGGATPPSWRKAAFSQYPCAHVRNPRLFGRV